MSSKDIRDPIPAHLTTVEFTARKHHVVMRMVTNCSDIFSVSLSAAEALAIAHELTAWAETITS
jgi:hypothetical protein